MTFSPGQNGKGGEKIMLNGKRKSYGFFERKLGTKNKKHPSFKKERLNVQQTNALRKKVAESHHHTPRSPQKRTNLPCDVSPADAEQFAEPLSTVELMPRELRTSKGASAQYVPVITARRLQPNEVPHDDFGTVNNKPL